MVSVDDSGVRCRWPTGAAEFVSWHDLEAVLVETNDGGPFVEDVFFVLSGTAGGCTVPQSAQGVSELVERLVKLPGFDSDEWCKAMVSTSNAQFRCWGNRHGSRATE